VTSDQGAVSAAVAGQEAVLTAFGSPTTWHGLVSPTLTRRSAPLITRAMRETGVRRLVFLSAHGVGDTVKEVPALYRPVYWMLGPMFADKPAGERIVRDSGLDWTLVYPAMLVGGRRTGGYRVGERVPLKGVARISRADVAEFMLRESVECAYLHKIVELAN
jgi:putative NADH-flavin reductase